MSKVPDLCLEIALSDPVAIVGNMLGVEIPEGREDECTLIMAALASAASGELVKVVGMYLYESEGVV